MTLVSLARTRTRTGCLTCRRRRKKCDETRPRCIACTRNALNCSWTSNGQSSDKRHSVWRGKTSNHTEATPTCAKCDVLSSGLCPPDLMPPPFQLESHRYLYRYFGSVVLPKLVRQNSLAFYTDQTYMLRLALEFPPLMGALISIAGMHLASTSDRWPVSRAVQSYIHTICMLREAISHATDFGSHDGLLATVTCLSVFESSRIDSSLKVAPHVTASGYLLTQRRVRWIPPQATAVFDRICTESFVYHASLMMLFDPSLDCLFNDSCRQGLSRCFSHSVHATQLATKEALDTQPILHTSYKFFLLIADATRLARLSVSLDKIQVHEWENLQLQVSQYIASMSSEQDLCARLYAFALQILLWKSNPNSSFQRDDHDIEYYVRECAAILPSIDQNRYFTSFLLWPLAVIGSVSLLGTERTAIREYMIFLAQTRLGGQALSVLKRLDKLWILNNIDKSLSPYILRYRGLQALLDGEDNLNNS